MALPSTINIQTALNVSVPTPVFNITDLTPYNTEGITLNNVSGSFTIVNPQGTTVYTGSGDVHYFAITSITQSAGIATVTTTAAHGLVTGDSILIGTATEAGYNISGKVTVTSPTTFTYLVASATSSPATGTPRGLKTSLNSIQIPLDSVTGIPLLGNYTITETLVISGGTEAGTYIKPFVYTNSYVRPIVSITQSVNCFISRFVSTDTTSYSVIGITPTIARLQTITFPSASGIPAATYSTARVQIDRPNVWNGIYTTLIVTGTSYTFADNLIVIDSITGNKTFEVSCQDICNINCCLNDANKAYTNSLQANGPDSQRTVDYLAVLTRALQLTELFQLNIQCGNTTDAATNLQDIYTVTGCTADCNCGSAGEVIPYDGLVGQTILEWDVVLPNNQGEYINFNNILYKVLNNTLAGYSPTLNPTFYQKIGIAAWGTITGTLSDQTDLQSALNAKITKFDVTKTKTGTTSVTESTQSGRITFTTGVAGTNKQQYTITNTLITATSSVILTLNYPMGGAGLPSIIYQELTTGNINFLVANPDGAATNQNIVVDFIIIS